MKKRDKKFNSNGFASDEEANYCLEQINQQIIQQRYRSELQKYQEQLDRREKLGTKNGHAA